MGWNCRICGTHNEDGDVECMVCGAASPFAERAAATPAPEPVPEPVSEPVRERTIAPTPEPEPAPEPVRESAAATPAPEPVPEPVPAAEAPSASSSYTTIVGETAAEKVKKGFSKAAAAFLTIFSLFSWLIFGAVFDITYPSAELAVSLTESLGADYYLAYYVAFVIEGVSCIFICYDLFYLTEREKYVSAWLVTIAFCLTLIALPILSAALLLVVSAAFFLVRKSESIRIFAIIYVIAVVVLIALYPTIAEYITANFIGGLAAV